MALKLKSASELIKNTQKGIIMAVYSSPDAGKSSFCMSASQHLNCLFIDTEKKFGIVWEQVPDNNKNEKNIFSLEINTLSDLIIAAQDSQISAFDIVIVDSITNLVDKEMQHITFTKGRKPNFDDWRELGSKFLLIVDNLKSKGINMLFTLHDKASVNELSGEVNHQPDAQGSLVPKKVIELSDALFFIEKTKGDRKMILRSGDEHCTTKSKFIPRDHKNEIMNEEICFDTIYKLFPEYAKKKKVENITKQQILELSKSATILKKIHKTFDLNVFIKAVNPIASSFESFSLDDFNKAISMIDDKIKFLQNK